MSHYFYKPHAKKQNPKHYLDKLIYLIALIAPIMTLPQILEIWMTHRTQGISLLTWGAYAGVSALWICYGLQHEEKPIILTNLLLFIFDTTIVMGVLIYR